MKFVDVVHGFGAVSKVPVLGVGQIAAYSGFCELPQDQSAHNAMAAGDFGREVPASSDTAEQLEMLAADFANGFLTTMVTVGTFSPDCLAGLARGDWSLYTGSPLRVSAHELGTRDSVGLWDPASEDNRLKITGAVCTAADLPEERWLQVEGPRRSATRLDRLEQEPHEEYNPGGHPLTWNGQTGQVKPSLAVWPSLAVAEPG